jgi:ABC-2 type transport system permease protein
MGLLEAVTLAIVPWAAMFLTEWTFGKTHALSQAAFHLVLLLAGGLLFFSMAFLASSVIEGEYTAPIVSFGAIIVTTIAFSGSGLRPYSPLRFMDGAEYLNHETYLLSWPIPWLQATIYVLVAALLLIVSVKVIQRREF